MEKKSKRLLILEKSLELSQKESQRIKEYEDKINFIREKEKKRTKKQYDLLQQSVKDLFGLDMFDTYCFMGILKLGKDKSEEMGLSREAVASEGEKVLTLQNDAGTE